jgi:hypothetical protein
MAQAQAQTQASNIEELVINLTQHFTKILSTDERKKYPELYNGTNGVGNRWANQKFNYCVIYSNQTTKNYSENNDDEIPKEILNAFLDSQKNKGKKVIIGIYVYSKRGSVQNRTIKNTIHKQIIKNSCVHCETTSDIVCDHKNDLYNDIRVLNTLTQELNDFQPLCIKCNLLKRAICIKEEKTQKIYSAKNMRKYQQHKFEFPWEKKIFDKTDINCKNDTYWFDPVEFHNKIDCYTSFVIPILNEIKRRVKNNTDKEMKQMKQMMQLSEFKTLSSPVLPVLPVIRRPFKLIT